MNIFRVNKPGLLSIDSESSVFNSPRHKEKTHSFTINSYFIYNDARDVIRAMKKHFEEGIDVDSGVCSSLHNISLSLNCLKRGEVLVPNFLVIQHNIGDILRAMSNEGNFILWTRSKQYFSRVLNASENSTPEEIFYLFTAVSKNIVEVAKRFRLLEQDIMRSGSWHNKLLRILNDDRFSKTTDVIRGLHMNGIRQKGVQMGEDILSYEDEKRA